MWHPTPSQAAYLGAGESRHHGSGRIVYIRGNSYRHGRSRARLGCTLAAFAGFENQDAVRQFMDFFAAPERQYQRAGDWAWFPPGQAATRDGRFHGRRCLGAHGGAKAVRDRVACGMDALPSYIAKRPACKTSTARSLAWCRPVSRPWKRRLPQFKRLGKEILGRIAPPINSREAGCCASLPLHICVVRFLESKDEQSAQVAWLT